MEQWKADALRRAHEDEILAQAAKIEAANRRGKVAACPEPKRTKVGGRIKTDARWATNCNSCWQCKALVIPSPFMLLAHSSSGEAVVSAWHG